MVEGEHNTKYFFSLERNNACTKTMSSTIDDRGNKVYDAKSILTEQAKYFQKLYTCDSNADCVLSDSPPNKISDLQRNQLEQELTMEELMQAVKGIPTGKSPGNSGFQADFYIVFWQYIKSLLFKAYQHSLKLGKLSYMQ